MPFGNDPEEMNSIREATTGDAIFESIHIARSTIVVQVAGTQDVNVGESGVSYQAQRVKGSLMRLMRPELVGNNEELFRQCVRTQHVLSDIDIVQQG